MTETVKPTIHHVGGANTTPVVKHPDGSLFVRVSDKWLPANAGKK